MFINERKDAEFKLFIAYFRECKKLLRMNRFLLTLLVLATSLSSCRKEKTSWDSNWSAPLVHGTLTINDLIPVEFTNTNTEGYLSLVFHDTAYSFSIDTLLNLPDTNVQSVINIGEFTDVTISPGFSFLDNYNSDYDLGEVELKRVILKEGTAEISVTSPWAGKTLMTISFPLIDESGMPFSRTYSVAAGSQTDPTIVSGSVDMVNFDMDLKGLAGLSFNEVPADFLVSSDESTMSFVVTNQDTVIFDVAFKNLVPKYAKGYFGQYTLSDTIGFSLAPMKKIIAGSLDIDSVEMRVTIKNGFNLIAQSTISKITGINSRTLNEVDLTFAELNNSVNINPATGGLWATVPSSYPIDINNLNSNITDFIENLPDSLDFGFELKINPEGNITAGSDELYPSSTLDLYVDAEFPLNFSANDLTLVDTFDINYNPIEAIAPGSGQITMNYDNGFPLAASATFFLLDENDVILDSIVSSTGILSGSYDIATYLTTPTRSSLTYSIAQTTIDNLELASRLMLKVSFTTDTAGKVKIDANAFFNFNIRTNLQITAKL